MERGDELSLYNVNVVWWWLHYDLSNEEELRVKEGWVLLYIFKMYSNEQLSCLGRFIQMVRIIMKQTLSIIH